jgi:hypothetical protein
MRLICSDVSLGNRRRSSVRVRWEVGVLTSASASGLESAFACAVLQDELGPQPPDKVPGPEVARRGADDALGFDERERVPLALAQPHGEQEAGLDVARLDLGLAGQVAFLDGREVLERGHFGCGDDDVTPIDAEADPAFVVLDEEPDQGLTAADGDAGFFGRGLLSLNRIGFGCGVRDPSGPVVRARAQRQNGTGRQARDRGEQASAYGRRGHGCIVRADRARVQREVSSG